jgi:hypothetical protein
MYNMSLMRHICKGAVRDGAMLLVSQSQLNFNGSGIRMHKS